MESARSTNGRYRRQDSPFIIAALNREVGWISVLRRSAARQRRGSADSGPTRKLEATRGHHLLRDATPEFRSRRLELSDQGAALLEISGTSREFNPTWTSERPRG